MTTHTTPEIAITTPEHRQIARVLEFSAQTSRHINWDKIAEDAHQLASHFEVKRAPNGAITVTFFWTYSAEELEQR